MEPFIPSVYSWVKGISFGLWLLITSTLGVVFFHFVPYLFAILFLDPIMYRKLADEMIGSWLIYCVALLEVVMGMKVVITGDKIRPSECNLIIMNHRTRLDWMYFWSVLARQSGVKTEKIILKSPLKKIPGAGWAMQVGAYIFIDRSWEKDKIVLSKMMNYFTDLKHKTQVLIFPEGTDLTARTKARSDDFAKKNGWAPYDYCLHPRTTGFTYLTQLMRQNNHLEAVYDVTVAYPFNFPQNEPELLKGNVPKEIHFNVQRFAITDLPEGEPELQTWCQNRWEQKEQILKRFSTEKRFPDSPRSDGDSGWGSSPVPGVNAEFLLKFTLVYWTVFVVGITLVLWYSSLARWLALAQVVFYVYMGHKRGGFELFQVDYFNWFFNTKKRS